MDCVIYDYDGDYDVDIRDYALLACRTFSGGDCQINPHFFECLGEHGHCVEMDCVVFDHDGDCDVDLQDLAAELCSLLD